VVKYWQLEATYLLLPAGCQMGDRAMPKTTLTDRGLKAYKPAAAGKTYDRMDSQVPGFGVRVSEKGRKTFILVTRFPGKPDPTRRAIGEYGAITLADARKEAQKWLDMIRRGVDPREERDREQQAEQRKRENSFRAVTEEFIRRALPGQRKARQVEQDLRREFIDQWGGRPITEITQHDIVRVLDAVVKRGEDERGRPAVHQAHNLLGHVRRLFNWAIARGVYGLDRSPCDRMKPHDVIGKKEVRQRVLNDAEIRALWAAAEALGYPYGPLFKLLVLTGQRKSEVAEARWSEFDLDRKLWTIPAERMKADAAHVVPLTDEAIAILRELPRFQKGNHLFSTTFGAKPVNDFAKVKIRLDEEMLKHLPSAPTPFVIHDIRRTMRTRLSALPVPDLVRELVIAHTKPGLHRVYDQYAYLDEKRRALDLWAAKLRDIVTPPPANVLELAKARA
jgi:integrase